MFGPTRTPRNDEMIRSCDPFFRAIERDDATKSILWKPGYRKAVETNEHPLMTLDFDRSTARNPKRPLVTLRASRFLVGKPDFENSPRRRSSSWRSLSPGSVSRVGSVGGAGSVGAGGRQGRRGREALLAQRRRHDGGCGSRMGRRRLDGRRLRRHLGLELDDLRQDGDVVVRVGSGITAIGSHARPTS